MSVEGFNYALALTPALEELRDVTGKFNKKVREALVKPPFVPVDTDELRLELSEETEIALKNLVQGVEAIHAKLLALAKPLRSTD